MRVGFLTGTELGKTTSSQRKEKQGERYTRIKDKSPSQGQSKQERGL